MQVFYDDPSHTYYTVTDTGNKQVYLSATTLIGRYKKPFDAISTSINYAKKHGQTPEYWREQWKKKRDDACTHGTAVHKIKEKELIQVTPKLTSTVECLTDYNDLPDGIYPELKLWHHGFRIAGRTDKAIIYTINGVRHMDIEDYKTNEDLLKPAFVNRNGETAMMLSPINSMHDCKMVHYSLQLSLYQYMAESLGFAPGKRTIIHIRNGLEQNYDVPYLRIPIEKILNHYGKSSSI